MSTSPPHTEASCDWLAESPFDIPELLSVLKAESSGRCSCGSPCLGSPSSSDNLFWLFPLQIQYKTENPPCHHVPFFLMANSSAFQQSEVPRGPIRCKHAFWRKVMAARKKQHPCKDEALQRFLSRPLTFSSTSQVKRENVWLCGDLQSESWKIIPAVSTRYPLRGA